MRRLICLGFLLAPLLPAQGFPDAATLLQKSAAALEGYQSVEFSTEMSTEMTAAGMPINTSMTTLFRRKQGKTRTEFSSAGMGIITVMVTDGREIWTYTPSNNHFTRVPETDSAAASEMRGPGAGLRGLDAGAKVIRSESIEIDGKSYDCWVAEARNADLPGGSARPDVHMHDVVHATWFDKDTGMAMQSTLTANMQVSPEAPAMTTKTKTVTHGLQLNPPLDDSLFVFTPPADASESAERGPVPDTEKPAAPAPGAPKAFVPQMKPLTRVEPAYPPAAPKNKAGTVQLLVTIDTTGNVTRAEVLSGIAIFRKPAVDAVRKQTYRPVIRDGKPVPAFTDAVVSFIPPDYKFNGSAPDDDGDIDEEMAGGQRILELQNLMPRTPAQIFADTEQQISGVTGPERFYALADLAKSALNAGLPDKAQSYANEMLASSTQYRRDWNYGNAVYTGNMVLGLIALSDNNVAQADEYLLASARTPGSPQLNSFGPDLQLARELARKGEKDAVLQYLELCRTFWKMGGDKLTSMATAVRSGEAF